MARWRIVAVKPALTRASCARSWRAPASGACPSRGAGRRDGRRSAACAESPVRRASEASPDGSGRRAGAWSARPPARALRDTARRQTPGRRWPRRASRSTQPWYAFSLCTGRAECLAAVAPACVEAPARRYASASHVSERVPAHDPRGRGARATPSWQCHACVRAAAGGVGGTKRAQESMGSHAVMFHLTRRNAMPCSERPMAPARWAAAHRGCSRGPCARAARLHGVIGRLGAAPPRGRAQRPDRTRPSAGRGRRSAGYGRATETSPAMPGARSRIRGPSTAASDGARDGAGPPRSRRGTWCACAEAERGGEVRMGSSPSVARRRAPAPARPSGSRPPGRRACSSDWVR